jgi:hypothetical protein
LLLLNKNNRLFLALANNQASQRLPIYLNKHLLCKTKITRPWFFLINAKRKNIKNSCLEDSAIFWPSIVKCLTSKHKKNHKKNPNHTILQLSFKV